MAILTRKDIQEMESYYYWVDEKHWSPFPEALKTKLLGVYGEESSPYPWTEQDIHEGSRKIIIAFFTHLED